MRKERLAHHDLPVHIAQPEKGGAQVLPVQKCKRAAAPMADEISHRRRSS
jgi:hypothetical protein